MTPDNEPTGMDQKNIQIEVVDLHKSYRDGEGKILHILQGVNLQIPRKATVAIVGASGTGKSTFLHVLGALDTAEKGKIYVEGQDLLSMKREQCARFRNQTVGFVFQFHHLMQDFTALENVMMPLRIQSVALSEAKKRASTLLQQVGLGDRLHHRPAQLSGGEQQRVAVARAIANSPKILLADEPTGNLDEETGQQILDLMLQLNEEYGITVIIITHNSALASSMKYQYRMVHGQLTLLTNHS